jgi:hypothetical protein
MARMKFLCDADRCIDCNACKNENEVPWGLNRRRVHHQRRKPGERSVSTACMHCTDAPCAAVYCRSAGIAAPRTDRRRSSSRSRCRDPCYGGRPRPRSGRCISPDTGTHNAGEKLVFRLSLAAGIAVIVWGSSCCSRSRSRYCRMHSRRHRPVVRRPDPRAHLHRHGRHGRGAFQAIGTR